MTGVSSKHFSYTGGKRETVTRLVLFAMHNLYTVVSASLLHCVLYANVNFYYMLGKPDDFILSDTSTSTHADKHMFKRKLNYNVRMFVKINKAVKSNMPSLKCKPILQDTLTYTM